jgi:hypothetical protein
LKIFAVSSGSIPKPFDSSAIDRSTSVRITL